MEEKKKKTKIIDAKEGLVKGQAYCAYQERCQQEVRDKLYELGLHSEDVENIISELITSNFLNEERFAKTFAGGKFRIKKWGRIKIKLELKKRNITDYCIRKGMAEINERDYVKTLKELLKKKSGIATKSNALIVKYAAAKFAISKGFEPELVWGIVNER